MQLFCNFSFVLFFQKGRALARISLFERSERDLLFFTLLAMNCDRIVIALRSVCDVFHLAAFPNRPASERFGEFFPTKPEFWRNLLFDLLLFLMVEKALVFVCIDI